MSHDIYTSKKSDDDRSYGARSGRRKKAPEDPWTSLVRQQRLRTALTVLLVLLITAMVVVIGFQQQLLNSPTTLPESTPPALNAESRIPSRFTPVQHPAVPETEEGVFVLDALHDVQFGEEEAGAEETPLHSRRLKEVVYHILMAEKARRDGLEDLALEQYEKALALYPDLQDVRATVGMIHMDSRNFEDAARAFEQALNAGSASFGVANNLAVAYLQLERWQDAEQALRQTIELRPSYAAAHYNLATLFVRMERPNEAAAFFQSFLQLEPQHLNGILSYAAILIQQEQWEQVTPLLEQAARMAPLAPPLLFRLAQGLGHTDRAPEAVAVLRRAAYLVDARNALAWMSRGGFDPLRTHPDFQKLVNELERAQR